MMVRLISGLILALITVTFIFQNTMPVTVRFLLWSFQSSLALLLFITFLFGIIVSLLVIIPLLFIRRAKKSDSTEKTKVF